MSRAKSALRASCMRRALALLLLAWLASVPTESGIPILHHTHVGAGPEKGQGCTHFSEIVSPSHGEVVSRKHFTLHVRCLAECGVAGAHVKVYLNEVRASLHLFPCLPPLTRVRRSTKPDTSRAYCACGNLGES